MKKYTTMITKAYIPDWDVADGIREIVANALDSDAEFIYDIGEDYIEITSTNTKLDISCFLLGVSGNRGNKDAVGRHGEGILISNVAILRGGASVTIFNGNLVWQPAFEMDYNFNKEILVINESEGEIGNKDYKVLISGLDSDILATVVNNCLYLQDKNILGNYATASCGSRVFFDHGNKLYVGGLFVCNTDLKYVYDMHPSKLPLNRDRKQVNDWDLQGSTSKVLKEVLDSVKIVELAKEGAKDIQHMQYSWVGSKHEVNELAYEDFKETYGEDCIVAADYDEMVDMQTKGYANVVPIDKAAYRTMITSSLSYQEHLDNIAIKEIEDEEETPVTMLKWFIDYCPTLDEDSADELSKIVDLFIERGVNWDGERRYSKQEYSRSECNIPF